MVTCILNLNSDEISQYSKVSEGWKDVTEAVKPVHTKLSPSQQGRWKDTEMLLLHSESRNIFLKYHKLTFLKAANAVLGSLFLILKGKSS